MKKTVTLDFDTLHRFEEIRMYFLKERKELPNLSVVVAKGIESLWKEITGKK